MEKRPLQSLHNSGSALLPKRKVLWVRGAHPDNYVDSDFLAGLRRNHHIGNYSYKTLVIDSSALVLNLALAALFVSAFLAIYRRGWDPRWFALAATPPHLALACKWVRTPTQLMVTAKDVAVTTFAVLALAPVFRSLSQSISSDTIWAMASWMCLANVVFSTRPAGDGRGILVLSINTALATTIVLASRLPTSRSVFYFICWSIETYVTLPTFARRLRADSQQGPYIALTALVSISSLVLVSTQLGTVAVAAYGATLAAVLLGVPVIFLAVQKHKDQIEGPWDPAVPILH